MYRRVNSLSDYLDAIHKNYSLILDGSEHQSIKRSGLNSVEGLQKKFEATYQMFEEISASIKTFLRLSAKFMSLLDPSAPSADRPIF